MAKQTVKFYIKVEDAENLQKATDVAYGRLTDFLGTIDNEVALTLDGEPDIDCYLFEVKIR